jgi:hypothetical protein
MADRGQEWSDFAVRARFRSPQQLEMLTITCPKLGSPRPRQIPNGGKTQDYLWPHRGGTRSQAQQAGQQERVDRTAAKVTRYFPLAEDRRVVLDRKGYYSERAHLGPVSRLTCLLAPASHWGFSFQPNNGFRPAIPTGTYPASHTTRYPYPGLSSSHTPVRTGYNPYAPSNHGASTSSSMPNGANGASNGTQANRRKYIAESATSI